MKLWRHLFWLLIVSSFVGCNQNSDDTSVKFHLVKNYISDHLAEMIQHVKKLNDAEGRKESIKVFESARKEYKTIEPFLVYSIPDKIKGVNGPPLPVFREDNGKVLPAIGFQALDEQLYSEDPLDSGLYYYRIKILVGYLEKMQEQFVDIEILPRRYFIPIHQQFFSIFSLGIISFDTPSSLRGLDESITSLNSIKEVYRLAIADTLQSIDKDLHAAFILNIDNAISYIDAHNDFETFDRYEFTRNHINKLSENWRDIRRKTGLFGAPGRTIALNIDAPTFFEENSFNVDYFLGFKRKPTEDLISLGRKLFFDPSLSAEGTLSCASCHQPEKAYQDGLILGSDKQGKPLQRNTPTIVNSVFQKKFFWDGRSDNLVQQINLVFDNEMEFGRSNAHNLSLIDLDKAVYDSMFIKSFPDSKKISRRSVVRALSAYVSTLNAFNSRFDKNMRGELDDFTEQEILGMNLYMGKALCATCHFLPLTNGTVPPSLNDTEREVIGTPETSENKEVDDDTGFYWVYQEDIHKYMFKTPTVRNSELTAPYMHNGVYESLEQVMDFYNKGGGGGMGFDLPHQTLPFDSLSLKQNELDALVAFMKTFTDTNVGEQYDVPEMALTN